MKKSLEQVAEELGFPVVVLPIDAAHSMESAISFLVDCLIEGGYLQKKSADEIVSSVLKRELLGTTAIGEGVAIPHSTCSVMQMALGIFARCACPVPWQTPDGKQIETICLILCPVDRPVDYMRALEKVKRAMTAQRE
jgi:mannitol/fructose-specific phosphotransferase system IIA component (Ntr-type)